MFESLRTYLNNSTENLPSEDQHQDEKAEVGDKRVKVLPRGEIFNYDSFGGEFVIKIQTYGSTASYSNGNKYYGWKHDKHLFEGTPEQWDSLKDNHEKLMTPMTPDEWDKIVEQTEEFLHHNRDQLDSRDYPHSTRKI